MRKDVDLIRLLLLDLEGEESVNLTDFTTDQINYHRHLLLRLVLPKALLPIQLPRMPAQTFRIWLF